MSRRARNKLVHVTNGNGIGDVINGIGLAPGTTVPLTDDGWVPVYLGTAASGGHGVSQQRVAHLLRSSGVLERKHPGHCIVPVKVVDARWRPPEGIDGAGTLIWDYRAPTEDGKQRLVT